MSKELTPLEALKEIREESDCGAFQSRCDIIETALKDYELLKERTKLDSFECLLRLEEILPRGKELLVPVAKQLKVLEIIKKKQVAVDEFIRCCKEDNPLEEYNNFAGDKNSLTQEEFNLLKEVLS